MSETSLFDGKAEKYDQKFTSSYVGTIQRNIVHDCVKKQLSGRGNLEILELNCGTGADISFLSQFGKVTSTDVSEEMLNIASKKNPDTKFQKLDLNKPISIEHKYDIIFSNFGGLNCVSPSRLKELNDELAHILKPGGQMFLVFMHKWSLVEFLYFSIKFKFKKAFRRIKGKATFKKLPIYYYSKKETESTFSSLKLKEISPIGILLTGEYMNAIGAKVKINENNIRRLSFIFGSDHILFNFIKPH